MLGRYTVELPPDDVEVLRERFERWEQRRSPDGAELWLNWAVRLREERRAIGVLQATVADDETAIAWTIGMRPSDRVRDGEIAWEDARAMS